MRSIRLFGLFGLTTTISSAGIVSFLLAALILAWLSAAFLELSLAAALLAGALSALAMFVCEWLHQLGHAFAARREGYPMTGVHFHSILSASVYPPDEPELPPSVHARRALGGFWVNLLLGLLLLPYGFFAWVGGGVSGWVTGFSAIYNLFIGLGALFPIDLPGRFTTDGGTLLRLWRERRAAARK